MFIYLKFSFKRTININKLFILKWYKVIDNKNLKKIIQYNIYNPISDYFKQKSDYKNWKSEL